jgi:hypothetical protein
VTLVAQCSQSPEIGVRAWDESQLAAECVLRSQPTSVYRGRRTRPSSQIGSFASYTRPILSKHEETIEVASEPSVVGDRHDGAVEGVEAGLEGLGGLDVEVVGRLVEQQQRGAGQLEQQDLEAGLAAA